MNLKFYSAMLNYVYKVCDALVMVRLRLVLLVNVFVYRHFRDYYLQTLLYFVVTCYDVQLFVMSMVNE